MKLNEIILTAIIAGIFLSATACTTTETPKANVNSNTAVVVVNGNASVAPSANIAVSPPVVAPSTAAATNNAAVKSPAATIAAYHRAMITNDEMAFRKVLSKATLAEFSKEAEAEGQKSLLKYWTSFSAPPAKPYAVKDEQIMGETAIIKINDGESNAWESKKLVREDGELKLDLTFAASNEMMKRDGGR